ncbi:MbtH family protein [Streptomyces sp. NPDC059578]|uniref:MbtH family protein n=1 Tax=Streptomyces sp. NPDC059578 TaxID=3346874 RepID=UPI003677E652
MVNPFEEPATPFLTLVNHQGQYSLWPASAEVPAGWRATFGPDSRTAALDHVERTWTELRRVSDNGDEMRNGERL